MRKLLVLLGLALALPGAALADGRWQVTALDGCYIWNPMAHAGDVVTWSGACVEGKATGQGSMAIRYTEGGTAREIRYDGRLFAGLADGRGRLALPDGSAYDGAWRAGHKQGQGSELFANGDRYDGGWEQDRMQGRGVLIYANGERYEGDFVDNKSEGQGRLLYVGGDSYAGQFHDGRAEGLGVYSFASGERYEGAFRDDAFNGQGTLHLDDVDVEGLWQDGQLVGRGNCVFHMTRRQGPCVQVGDKIRPAF